MKRKAKIAIIVEGAKTERQIFNSINELFFSRYDIVSFVLPTCTNIYSVWKYVKDDEVDIIEAIKELIAKQNTLKHKDRILGELDEYRRNDFSEIYLFYDLDAHHNLRQIEHKEVGNDILNQMFAYFDNETEHGKLYISYPMVEAIKHFSSFKHCDNASCFYPVKDGKQFKKFVSNDTCINDFKKLDLNYWVFIIRDYIVRVQCLFNNTSLIDKGNIIESIKRHVKTETIYNAQFTKHLVTNNSVMILSAIPEFIIDYFEVSYLNELLDVTDRQFLEYPKDKCHQINED